MKSWWNSQAAPGFPGLEELSSIGKDGKRCRDRRCGHEQLLGGRKGFPSIGTRNGPALSIIGSISNEAERNLPRGTLKGSGRLLHRTVPRGMKPLSGSFLHA